MSPALQSMALRKGFDGHSVLRDVSFSVAPGELVSILGNSGSGKTTLLRLICGFERADAGEIAIGGRRVTAPGLHLPPERRHLGYVAQEGSLFPHLSVANNILFGLPRRERNEQRAAALLERVGLPAHYARRGPHQLSGGEQQRVALARALAPSPKLVLLDEPFSALDAALRVETRLAVARSLAEAGAAAILVTHDQVEALSLGQRVGVLRGGALIQMDTPVALYRRPIDLELARFVGEAVVVPGDAEGEFARCCLGLVPLERAMHGRVALLLRPEQLRLSRGGTARVHSVKFGGPNASVGLELDGTALLANVPGYAAPSPGDFVAIQIDGRAMAFAEPGMEALDGVAATLT